VSIKSTNPVSATASATAVDVDVVVIGAGIGGLRMLHEVRRLGLSCHVFEAATDVGGTWYWNRYPGARFDSETWDYGLAFSDEHFQEWDWSERYATQPEALSYARHVADRFEMRKDISFSACVVSAAYDETSRSWTVTTDSGATMTCTYLVTALGLLSEALEPPFPGVPTFRGDWYVTGHWPHDPVDFSGKRVGVIGTGATAIQLIPEIVETAGQVTVFQRTPNYVIPRPDRPLGDAERAEFKRDCAEIFAKAHDHFFGFSMGFAGRTWADVTPEERQQIFEEAWQKGGFQFIFNSFDDIFTDMRSAEAASEFIRTKIRQIVKDPETAELLCPTTYPLASKRPPLGSGYYEAFNRDNVNLVDVKDNPIETITPDGLKTQTDEYEFDAIIFATGFDAATGSFANIDIRGRAGKTINDTWAPGPRTYLGITVAGFPNLFMICGPQTPFANIPMIIDGNVRWIGRAIAYSEDRGIEGMEPTPAAVENWRKHVGELLDATTLGAGEVAHSWFLGANVPGKPHEVLFYFGGAGRYFAECDDVVDNDFKGFTLSHAPAPA
jgi:cyclohexanone monooxygenase